MDAFLAPLLSKFNQDLMDAGVFVDRRNSGQVPKVRIVTFSRKAWSVLDKSTARKASGR